MNRDVLIRRNRQYVAEFLGKPIVLVVAIATIATAILAVVLSVFASVATISAFGDVLQNMINDISSDIGYDIDFNQLSVRISIPFGALVTFVAFLLMYLGAKNIDKSTSKAGLIIYRVLGVASLVFSIISVVLLALCILFFLFIIVMLSSPDMFDISDTVAQFDAMSLIVFFAVLAFLLVIVAIYTLLYSISFNCFAKSLYKSYTTETLTAKGSKFYAAMSIISVILPLFSAVTALILIPFVNSMPSYYSVGSGYYIPTSAVTSLLVLCAVTNLVSVISPILDTVFALSYHKHISAAGINGEHLPMPTMPTAPDMYQAPTQYDAPAAPAQPVDTVASEYPAYSEPVVTEETPASSAAAENPAAAEATPISEVNPYAMPEPSVPAQSAPEQPAAPQSAVGFCCNCGKPVAPEQNFCNYCGSKLK